MWLNIQKRLEQDEKPLDSVIFKLKLKFDSVCVFIIGEIAQLCFF